MLRKSLLAVYTLCCTLALALIILSKFEWLGVENDPLSAIPAVILGLPWSGMIASDSPLIGFAALIISMLINGTILWFTGSLIARLFSNKRRK